MREQGHASCCYEYTRDSECRNDCRRPLIATARADVKGRMRELSGGAIINVYFQSVAANGTKLIRKHR
jgi:hypothetical protein